MLAPPFFYRNFNLEGETNQSQMFWFFIFHHAEIFYQNWRMPLEFDKVGQNNPLLISLNSPFIWRGDA
jgi:hypothetical protein